jgi:hypothetical protein
MAWELCLHWEGAWHQKQQKQTPAGSSHLADTEEARADSSHEFFLTCISYDGCEEARRGVSRGFLLHDCLYGMPLGVACAQQQPSNCDEYGCDVS